MKLYGSTNAKKNQFSAGDDGSTTANYGGGFVFELNLPGSTGCELIEIVDFASEVTHSDEPSLFISGKPNTRGMAG